MTFNELKVGYSNPTMGKDHYCHIKKQDGPALGSSENDM